MPSFNLTTPQVNIIRTWLFEPWGYLESQINDAGISALTAWQADNNLDVTQWIRDNTPRADVFVPSWDETAMVWWIYTHDKVNVPTPRIPPEAAQWIVFLDEWDASINRGFVRAPQNERDSKNAQLYGIDQQPSGTIPSGSHLAQQQLLINKVKTILN